MIPTCSNLENRIPITPREITACYLYGYTICSRIGGFDPESATLLALSQAISTFDPGPQNNHRFKTHYVYRLRREADADLCLQLHLKRNVPKDQAYKTGPLTDNNNNNNLSENPYPYADLKLDLYRALAHIPLTHRRIVVNHLHLGHSLKSISIILGISYPRIRNMFYEGIIYLRESLEGYEDLGEPTP